MCGCGRSEGNQGQDETEERQTSQDELDDNVLVVIGRPHGAQARVRYRSHDEIGRRTPALEDHHEGEEGHDKQEELAQDVEARGSPPLETHEAGDEKGEDSEDDDGDVHGMLTAFVGGGVSVAERTYIKTSVGSRFIWTRNPLHSRNQLVPFDKDIPDVFPSNHVKAKRPINGLAPLDFEVDE